MLRLPTGIGSSVSSYFPWHTLLKVHSLSERITELTCAAQFSGRKRVDVLCSAQGHFTLSSHWLHRSKHRLTLAEIKPPNLESSYKLGWNLIAWKERSETNEGKCQFETFPPEKCKWLNWETGDVPPPPTSKVLSVYKTSIWALMVVMMSFMCLSAPLFILRHSVWHTATAPNQPLTAGFCLRGLIGWLTKLINTPPGVT